ncbi:MAG: hypothetical protein OEY50_07385 [Nitrospinota bacterium]|nr:hypothetical protein [Nitrospinota bacterium]
MPNTLGALTLPGQIMWIDRYSWAPATAQVERTIAGSLAMFSQSVSGGRPITLEAREGVAWLSQAEVDAIMVMAAQPGVAFTLDWNGEQHTVRFAHHSPPATEFSPIWPFADQYTGTIKLITI